MRLFLGKYITMLPAIQLSLTIDPDTALSMRNPTELQTVSKLFRYYNFADYYESRGGAGGGVDGDGSSDAGVGPNQSLSLSLVIKNLSVRAPGPLCGCCLRQGAASIWNRLEGG